MSARGTPGAFSPAVAIAIALVGAFAFSAFFVLSAFAPEMERGQDGRTHALSRSAVGFAGAVRLLRESGRQVEIGRNMLDASRGYSLVVLSPEHGVDAEELQNALGQQTLVILPKWLAAPHPLRRGWVQQAGLLEASFVASTAGELAQTLEVFRRPNDSAPSLQIGNSSIPSGVIRSLQTIRAENVEPVVVDENGGVILGQVSFNGAAVYILSDPDFLNTQGVADIQTARAGLRLLDIVASDFEQAIVFDVTLNGLGAARSPLRLAFEPPFLGATLALALAAVLLGWRSAVRTGPTAPRARAIMFGKRTLVENAAALLRLTGREGGLGGDYAALTAAMVREKSRAPLSDDQGLDQLGAGLGVRTRFSELAAEARNVREVRPMLASARKLFDWMKEISRATR